MSEHCFQINRILTSSSAVVLKAGSMNQGQGFCKATLKSSV